MKKQRTLEELRQHLSMDNGQLTIDNYSLSIIHCLESIVEQSLIRGLKPEVVPTIQQQINKLKHQIRELEKQGRT